MAQTPAQPQTPQAPAAAAKPQAPARPPRPPAPTVPPEFDALPIWKMKPPELVAMVKNKNSTLFQKAIACKKLAFVGGRDAIQPAAALLSHPQLSCYARFCLEPNPDPMVDDVLRAALPKLSGKLQIGVITTIGVRKDAKALDALIKLMDSSDAEVACAAAASVGMIGGLRASTALQATMAKAQPPLFPVAARASLLAAESLWASNKPKSLELYTVLSATNMPEPVRRAAIRILNADTPAPPGAKDYPPPTGEAAERDRSGFLGRGR